MMHSTSVGVALDQNSACMAKLYLCYDQFESCAKKFAAISSKLRDGWEERRVQVPSNPGRETIFLVKSYSLLISDGSHSEDVKENDHTSLEQLVSGEGLRIEEEDDPAIISLSGDTPQHPSLPAADQTNLALSQNSQHVATPAAESSHSSSLSVHVEYHIVHSFSYEVPVLYFNATYSNGRQLSLQDMWKLLSDRFVSSDVDRWGLVSQQEHPLLHCPFYHIHPCHTAKVMAQARKSQTDVNVLTETERESKEGASKDGPNTLVACNDGGDDAKEGQELSKFEPNYLVTWLSTFGPLVGLKVPLEYSMHIMVN